MKNIYIIWFDECSYNNKQIVGGKNASLGELRKISEKLNFHTANGFALTTNLYDDYILQNNISDLIKDNLQNIDINNIDKLNDVSDKIKNLILNSSFNDTQIEEIIKNFNILMNNYDNPIQVAVRSSAIAEDMPNASFAGQQDTYLNIETEKDFIECIIKCYASLFNSRAISYRETNNIDFSQIKMSISVQKMVRSDIGSAGVGFSIDPESGYNKAIVINSSFGLGELVVSGGVLPDEFILDKRLLEQSEFPIIDKKLGNKLTKIVYDSVETKEVTLSDNEKTKFSLNDQQCIYLAKTILNIEKSYKNLINKDIGIDIEWALDGLDNNIYIIQARPETIHSNNTFSSKKYILESKSKILLKGVSVGEKISCGKVKYLKNISEHTLFEEGDILVTEMTTPDWEPIMKKSSGIITEKGGRTCHAAIVARELQINAIVGTGNGIEILKNECEITMSCAEGETGVVYQGLLPFRVEEYEFERKDSNIKMMLNIASPDNCFSSSLLPHNGVGLARLEFIINNYIKIHPLALLEHKSLDPILKNEINKILNVEDLVPEQFFIKHLSRGIAKIASAFYPEKVIVRLSDFKSNEYKNLLGGNNYEPDEENPMLGWRGASRYYSENYRKAFDLECQAIKFARDNMKLNNIIIMIPFCRTTEECIKIIDILEENGLKRGVNELEIYIMCEIPSNVIEAEEFSKLIDGVSIGGNDLLQLTLGVDRDSESITYLSKDTNLSYRRMISKAIEIYKKNGVKVGFCGQQPSDSVEFANFLVNEGIDSISVTPDSLIKIYQNINN